MWKPFTHPYSSHHQLRCCPAAPRRIQKGSDRGNGGPSLASSQADTISATQSPLAAAFNRAERISDIPDRHTCVICFRALSKHEGSELSSSSVERWVSTLSMTSLLNMSSLAVACATTVTNYLDLCEDGDRPTLDPATCAPSSVPAGRTAWPPAPRRAAATDPRSASGVARPTSSSLHCREANALSL